MQCLIKTIVAVILLVGAASSCPSACGCTNTSDGVDVDCSRGGLDSIPTDLPNNTYSLKLQYNDISVIENNTFNNLPRLYHLWLNNNNISVIENNAFNNLPNLQYLYLSSNDISVIENNTFNNLPNLRELYLGNNTITSIKSDTFNNLTNLYMFYLDDNKITSIKSDTFNNLTNLAWLGLQNNDILVIEDKAFNNLPNLQYLELQNNDISVIEDKAFNNLPNLQFLELENNDISVIEDKAFNNLPNFQYLYLEYNKITSIKSDTFNNLASLYRLSMENNPITFVSEHAFENLPQLTTLNFEMYCGGCENIPFWRWLKLNQKFSTSITCYDFDGQYLSNLQPNNFTDCSVHGNWGPWKDWNSCSLTCGSGSRSRRQECNNPEPAYGGSHCQGNDTEIESCSIELCPVASEEDSSPTAIGIGAGIGSTAVVVGLLIVFMYILRRYRLRRADPQNSDLHIYMIAYHRIQNHRRTDKIK